MNIDEIILKCQIGEDHLDQAEYEQVARWLEELEVYKKALELACETIVDRDCTCGFSCSRINCELYAPCNNEIGWEKHFLDKAREEE